MLVGEPYYSNVSAGRLRRPTLWQAARTSSPTKVPPWRSPSSSTTSSTGRRGSFKQREFSNIILNQCPPIVLTGKLFTEQLCVWVCGLLLQRCLVDPMSNHCHAGLERGSLACVLIGGKLQQCEFFPTILLCTVSTLTRCNSYIVLLRYITNLRENAEEGTKLLFEGGLDRVEDLDKVTKIFKNRWHSLGW